MGENVLDGQSGQLILVKLSLKSLIRVFEDPSVSPLTFCIKKYYLENQLQLHSFQALIQRHQGTGYRGDHEASRGWPVGAR